MLPAPAGCTALQETIPAIRLPRAGCKALQSWSEMLLLLAPLGRDSIWQDGDLSYSIFSAKRDELAATRSVFMNQDCNHRRS